MRLLEEKKKVHKLEAALADVTKTAERTGG
jgi:hypothetical protein